MALLVIATVLHVLLPALSIYQYSSIYLAGALVSAGFTVMMLAWWKFQKYKVEICPTAKTNYLITDGVYRFTRNPMYLGMVTMLGGVAVFFGTLPYYAVTILYFVVMDRWFCLYEEEKLMVTFEREFASYRSNVRRWL